MMMKNDTARTIDGTRYCRVQFTNITEGDELARMPNGIAESLGTVAEIERDRAGTKRVALSTGKFITRRGWMNKRIWKRA